MRESPLVIEIEREDGLGEDNPKLVADGRRWRVLVGGLENFGGVSYEVSTQAYAQYDGSLVMRERTPEQDRTMVIEARFDPSEARDEAMSFFIPHREYTVRCTLLGRTRHFKGRQYALSVALGSLSLPTSVTWTCLSEQPFWLSEDEHGYDLAQAQGRRGFPFVSFNQRVAPAPQVKSASMAHVAGFVVGIVSHATRLVNGGHVPTYPRFTISAVGTVKNPSVTVRDGSGQTVLDVTVLTSLQDGDELVLDFESRPTSIELNGGNVSHLVEPGSTLAASIGVGEYDVEWSAEAGDASMRVVPSIRERYTGI